VSYTDKMDVLDLIIETLKEHEKVLDGISRRLEGCLPGRVGGSIPALSDASELDKLDSWR